MINRCLFAAAAAGFLTIATAAQAQQNVCTANLTQILAEYGIKYAEIGNPTWQTLRQTYRGDDFGPVSGYQFYGQPASCKSGSLYVSITTGCEISNMHTDGGCMIKGIPNHWW